MNQQKLPNATAVLVLGIVSIVGCCCYGVVGLIAGIIGLVLYKKDNALYQANPTMYSDYNNLNTGKILCIIGLSLSALYLILNIVMISVFGWEALSDQQLMQERIRELMGQ
ncbi:CCC motif membrane protein [Chryseobacterium luquanense]|uniref:CCC motif membrane protein n=1 Tax=Chryseobacterium luquanense TaxID=2983766 RepID=A0ABT3Y8A8_9FLAO|nr:CCC motif membrane protein [Chryseobacterium luquanense]MCX8534400.1 CCC motif membrane protein [Chryseobacterium luquanense]